VLGRRRALEAWGWMQASAVGRGGSSPSHLNLCFKPLLCCPSLLTLSTSVCPPPPLPPLCLQW
jgi:hypothetical protein